jgi:hypothetical protein
LKYEGVRNVVSIFQQRFPKALLPADMKTMDGRDGRQTRCMAAAAMSSTSSPWRPKRRPKHCAPCAFVISGNLGLPDAQSHCGLPSDEIERHIRDFIAQVSAAG